MQPNTEKRVILIVDDNVTNLKTAIQFLQADRFEILVARNGEDGLERAQRGRPDLILLDVRMPGIDGFETCRRLKADPHTASIPVIFMTALAHTEDKVRGLKAGAVDYITKPVEEAELVARVNTHLALQDMLRNEMDLERHRSLTQMGAKVAHELNTPLGIANTAADIVLKRLSLPEVRALFNHDKKLEAILADMLEAAGLVERNIARAHTLVRNFKNISVNQLTDSLEKVDLPETVAWIVDLFKIQARRANLKIDIKDTLAETSSYWTGYPGYLTQVLMNLLTNIERYAYPDGQGGQIEIVIAAEMANHEPRFRLTVRDFGQGIPPENLAKVYEPFFTTGQIKGGTGLGLAIVHNVITSAFKGEIQIESEAGQGTLVMMTFPQTIIV